MLLGFIILAFIGTILVFLKFSLWRQKYSQQLPGKYPNFFDVFGDLREFMFSKDIHKDVLQLFTKRVKEFQKDKLFCVWISYMPFVALVKAEAVKELLLNPKMNEKGFMYKYMEPAMGTGLATSSAAKAKYRKKFLTPCFHPDVLRKYLIVFNDYSEQLVNVLKAETTEDATAIENIINSYTLDIIVETLFGVTYDALKNEGPVFKTAVERGEDIIMTRTYRPWLWPSFIFWSSKPGRDLNRDLKLLEKISRKIIKEKKERYLRGEKEIYSGKYKALLDLLLEKNFESQELSDADIQEEVHTFVLAGLETVASAISWALFLIGHHADIQAKIHEEIDQLFGEDIKRPITENDLRNLQYLDCVLKEVLRIYPTVPQFVRKATEDIKVCGYTIPKSASCVVYTYFLHRDEDVFPDPEKFDPDRFLPENAAKIPEYGYLPFSVGPRKCIGYKYAEMEFKTLVCQILRHFTVESLDEREKIEIIPKFALHPSIPLRVKIRSRSFK